MEIKRALEIIRLETCLSMPEWYKNVDVCISLSLNESFVDDLKRRDAKNLLIVEDEKEYLETRRSIEGNEYVEKMIRELNDNPLNYVINNGVNRDGRRVNVEYYTVEVEVIQNKNKWYKLTEANCC